MKITIPKEADFVIQQLLKNNFQAYIVGGCVRDSLLNRNPKDWDITTNALPENIQAIFKKTIPTGIKHGTVTVVLDNENIEVTTYRVDGDYLDGRHPSSVTFTNLINEDLSRRDFTINAMAYNPFEGLKDPFDGIAALSNKLIQCVGTANDRFNEDALRMLRAVRFSAQLDFQIEASTFKAITQNHDLITKISSERIRDEFCKILLSEIPSKGISLLHSTGLLQHILPELEQSFGFNQKNPHHNKNIFDHLLNVMDNSPRSLKLRLAGLFHDIGKPATFSLDDNGVGHFYKHDLVGTQISQNILKRLKFDNKTIEDVSLLIDSHMTAYAILKPSSLKKLITRIGEENLEDLFQLQIADTKGHAEPHDFSIIYKNRENSRNILENKLPLTFKDLKINGKDILELGVLQGSEVGVILSSLLENVLISPELNTEDILIQLAKKLISKK